MKRYFTLLLLFFSLVTFSQSTTVVISQVNGGGGGSTGTYLYDYVELHNVSNVSQSLNGMSIQYGSSTGNFGASSTNIYAFPAGTSIAAGGYLLIQVGPAGTAGAAFPVTPDLITSNLTMSASSGKVALINQATAAGCGATATPCTIPGPLYIDVVSYGASNNGEGGTTVGNGTALTSSQGAVRKTNGCTETDNNNNDFNVVTAPVPRNSASTPQICGAPSPSLSATTLTAFGNVCLNTTAGPNSFTITGTNLTTANVTVASLAGYSFATSAAGPYTSSLSLTQTGGAYSQQIFVNFLPTAAQLYSGDIVVGGGGASASVNVAASGTGVNTTPTVTTGSASGITTSAATVAGTINTTGCSAVTAYGIEYSLTSGFANGTGTQAASTNLSGGNYTSSLSGLATATTYYYKAYATNAGGTSWGAELSFVTASLSPTVSATTLTAFGNVCTNTTAGPNSFTINGSNLTTANITVGPLAGYSFSTTSGGTYTSSLTLTQTGGTYSQQIFVKFNPTAVQSYSGSIPVAGGGATGTTNVAASGSGVNSAPTVTTGSASGITTSAATLAGAINNIGCSAVTAYGIYYSTTNGFPDGTGTQVPASNLTGGNFSAGVSGLAASTTYYFKVYATNGGGTSYGAQQQFNTAAPPPSVLSGSALATFGNVCFNAVSATNSFTITGTNLTNAAVTVGPLTGYSFSTSATGTFTPSLSLTQPGGSFTQIVYVKLTPTAVQSYNGNIPLAGGGSTTTVNVAATGAGVSTPPSVTTMAAANITTNSVAFPATITASGCTPVSQFGIEYSGVNNFANNTGNKIYGTLISSGMYALTVNGLVQGGTYYYKAFVTNDGGTTYGTQQSVTLAAIPKSFTVYPVPVIAGKELHFSMDSLKQGYYAMQFYNSAGQKVLEKGFNVQSDFINNTVTIPVTMPMGIYNIRFTNSTDVLDTKTILVIK